MDRLWDDKKLGVDELRVTIEQYIGKSQLSLSLGGATTAASRYDGIFRRRCSLVGFYCEFLSEVPGLWRSSISLRTIVRGQSGSLSMTRFVEKPFGRPGGIVSYFDEVADKLFIFFEGISQLICLHLASGQAVGNYVIGGMPVNRPRRLVRWRVSFLVANAYGGVLIGCTLKDSTTIYEVDCKSGKTDRLEWAPARQRMSYFGLMGCHAKPSSTSGGKVMELAQAGGNSLTIKGFDGSLSSLLNIVEVRVPPRYSIIWAYYLAPCAYLVICRVNHWWYNVAALVNSTGILCSHIIPSDRTRDPGRIFPSQLDSWLVTATLLGDTIYLFDGEQLGRINIEGYSAA
ncbi:hypothetical protein FOL47_007881 [Perkinsus chesapeaki]|uniref:Uncharacterized protein n=1 Tax=Perkinsus chesapeaki TaxID=330153 RepID=A0A7J6LHC3_PERCH|nr:hypothetical protein FOL47_007881 [Perkinsus chesapeaki]